MRNASNVIQKTRCLVLGGSGFIGSYLVEGLLEQNFAVTILDRSNTIKLNQNISSCITVLKGDFANEPDIARALTNCDICFHLISTVLPSTSNLDPLFDIETNLKSTVNLLNQAVKANIKKIIFVSSGGTIYGTPKQLPIDENHPTNPICSYGITKLAIEKYLELYYQLHGLDYMILRLSNPYGEKQPIEAEQGAVAVFLGKAFRNETVDIWGDGSVVRDYIHISDVIEAMIASIFYSGSTRLLNIGTGIGTSLNEVLDCIEHLTGHYFKRNYVALRQADVPINVLSIDRAIKILDWQPKLSFREGLRRVIEHHKIHVSIRKQ